MYPDISDHGKPPGLQEQHKAGMVTAGKKSQAPARLPFVTPLVRDTVSVVGVVPTLLKETDGELPVKRPSDYINERSLSTAEGLAKASKAIHVPPIIELIDDLEAATKHSSIPIDRPLFQPFPSKVHIQAFVPFETYEIIINFRNDDTVPRKFRVESIDDANFSIIGMKSDRLSAGKVAPGMEVSYLLRFTPEALMDYKYDLICVTEREKFVVPIQAIGARALLDFPDEVVFPEAAVKHESVRTLFVRNIGNLPAKFTMDASYPFSVHPKGGYLDLRESMQIDVLFRPEQSGSFHDELRVNYDTGEHILTKLIGTAEDAQIRLDKSTLRMDKTYITLRSTKKVYLHNRSNIMAQFQWKRFATSEDEEHYRLRQNAELSLRRDEEIASARSAAPAAEAVDLSLLSQKYHNRMMEAQQDPLLFDDPIYHIEPTAGTIWPNSSIEVTVYFNPMSPGLQVQTAYCDVAGREMRLPLTLKGEAIGPQAKLSYDLLDIEEIYINTVHTYEVIMENNGEIDVHYSLLRAESVHGSRMSFTPDSGVLSPGKRQALKIVFRPDTLGTFVEDITFDILGASKPLVLTMKGTIAGPSFHFDRSCLSFGDVAFGFETTQTVTLVNTSAVPMTCALRVVDDEADHENECVLEPQHATIHPFESIKVQVLFTPMSVREYDTFIAVDVEHVGKDVHRLPISATSIVPDIKLTSVAIDCGDCYLNHPHDEYICFENESPFPARYKLLEQEESARSVYLYESTNPEGIIPPKSQLRVHARIQLKRAGQITFPMFCTIRGSEDVPVVVDISANGIGPHVIVSTTDLNWGKIPVLIPSVMTFTMRNDSPIKAAFECKLAGDISVFSVTPGHGVINPFESLDISVTALLDDCLKFTDMLKLAITSSGTYEIQLAARGQGSTVTFDESLKSVQFNDVFSRRECGRQFTLHNRGRRTQTLVWSIEEKKTNGSFEPVFDVIPARFTLKPDARQDIVIKGYVNKPMEISETLICQSIIEKDPTRREIICTKVSANFINPLVEVTPSSLRFVAAHQSEDDCKLLTEDLELKNISALPLLMSFKCPAPFAVEPSALEDAVEPGEIVRLTVSYDPSSHRHRVSTREQAKLAIRYAEHPQKDYVEMFSEVTFPNITLDTHDLDFSSIPVNTEQTRSFTITNSGILPVSYSWSLEDLGEDESDSGTDQAPNAQAFDLRPLRGTLLPGESESMLAIFYGHLTGKFHSRALCDVTGGPNYEVRLHGEVSRLDFQFDRLHIDFGTRLYQEITDQEVILSNTGRVSFDYNISLREGSALMQRIAVYPSSGTIVPQSRQKITVRCCVAVPGTIDDSFFVKIAQFEPVGIRVTGTGAFPHLAMDIPRMPDATYDAILHDIKTKHGNHEEDNGSTRSDLEAEAERALLFERTLRFLERMNEESRATGPQSAKCKFIGSTLLFSKGQGAKAGDKRAGLSLIESSHIRLADYLCDFGNVIRNSSKKKSIRVHNYGTQPISFTLEKGVLVGTGFSIEPDKVKLLPGAQHNESVEIQVTFQARSAGGLMEVDLPVKVVGGPTYNLKLRGVVTVPDMELSSTEVDFGELMCGFRKSMAVRLHNPHLVPCEWMINLPEEGKGAIQQKTRRKTGSLFLKDFDFLPASGTLEAGEKTLLTIRFQPMEERLYDEVLQLKVNMNSKTQQLRISGRGFKPAITFEPETLTLGPVLPFSDGATGKVTVHNPTSYPLEFFSVDFDQQYHEEEELLRQVMNEGSSLYMSPRQPGGGLAESVTELAAHRQPRERLAQDGTVGDLADVHTSPFVNRAQANNHPDNQSSEQPVSVIIHGPPFSGRSSLARRLVKKYGYAAVSVDDIFASQPSKDKSDYFKTLSSSVSTGSISSTHMAARDSHGHSVAPAQEHDNNGSQNLNADHLAVPAAIDHYAPPGAHLPLSEDVAVELIKARITRSDCSKGVIFDGLESKFGGPALVLRAILRALSEKNRKPIFFNLTVDTTHIREREAGVQRGSTEKDNEILEVYEISEQEYDQLNETERENYDRMIAKYRRRLKEQQQRKKLEHRQWEEALAARLNERKAEEEKAKSKKGKKVVPSSRPAEKGDKTAPSPGGRSDAARLSRNNLSEGRTGAMTPRNARKPTVDRTDRGSVMGDKVRDDFGDRIERDGENDLSSRFTLNEGGELFLNESTYRRVDSYSATLDAIVLLLKDGDKPITAKPVQAPTGAEKKGAKSKSLANPSGETANPAQPTGDADSRNDEAPRFYIEVNGNVDEEMVLQFVSRHLPVSASEENKLDQADAIPPPIIEQVISYPYERKELSHPMFFSLLPGNGSADSDEDPAETAPAFIPPVGPPPPAQTTGPAGRDVGRKQKQASKLAEDVKVSVDTEDEVAKEEIKRFRWVIQPHDRRELTIKFSSTEVGRFEQTLTFELVGAKGRFTLLCVGECQYTQIVGDPRKVFSKWRKIKEDTTAYGEYIASTATYEFGPLLYSKPKEKYLDKFPENRALLNIANPGPSELKVAFALRHDTKGEVFFFEPPGMELEPGQAQPLTIWAFPRSNAHFEDVLVVSVKDNPAPYCYKLSCTGVKPELEADKKTLAFDKLLLGKMEHRDLKLKNITLLPLAWRLVGADLLGDEFQVAPVDGVLEPGADCIVRAEFRGMKPVVAKKAVKVEVSDTEKMSGVVQEVPIVVTAEAYDIAVDLHFPKGYEGGIDFGVVKVYEEGKQTCNLRNRGKYEVGYRFLFESKEHAELFSVAPQQGVVPPSDKPFQIQLIFRSVRELHVKDIVGCKCQFFEPNTGEVTAVVPIKLSARAVFSKFGILPVRDLNFGALIHGTKATRQFIIENLGEFDFRYSVYKLVAALSDLKLGNKTRTSSRASKVNMRSTSPPSSKIVNRKEMSKQGETLSFGAFTLFPTSGVIGAGQKQIITVEFHAETPGSYEEVAAIDISDRSVTDSPEVLEYKLLGESCVPGICTNDFTSFFEEQTVCKRLELSASQASYYAEDDRVFQFGAFLAGHQTQARFKLSNPFKVPCEVVVATRPRTKTRNDAAEFAFDVEPKRLTIPSHESRYVTVVFQPTSIQSYAGIFEATVENVGESKTKTLSFELRGEGTLPRVSVVSPSTKNKNGLPLLHFRRLLLGTSAALPITLRNDGILPARIKLDWAYKDTEDFDCSALNVYHVLTPQETRNYEIRCRASSQRKMEAEVRIKVADNSFEDTSVFLQAEGFLDDVTFAGLGGDGENEITLSDCHIGHRSSATFYIVNHSNDYLRIAFDETQPFTLKPGVAHIRPKSRKEVTLSLTPSEPCRYDSVPMSMSVAKIKYASQPPDSDWDDQAQLVRWAATDYRNSGPKKSIEQLAEPTYQIVSPLGRRTLLAFAFADYANFACDVNEVKFRETLMFQTRVFNMSMKNTGSVALHYNFSFLDEEDEALEPGSTDCPFSALPASGMVPAGNIANVTLRFSPLDVGEFYAKILCGMPNLAPQQKPLQVHARGTALRPFCHFEIDDSDYLTRRNHEASSASLIPGSLDAATKVLEFESCGVRIKNTKRFYLVNPTTLDYAFEWAYESGDTRLFKCLNPKGLVAAGKKFELIFDYTPESMDLKESLWRFTIPAHKISIPFLLVGRATEPNVFMDRPSVNFKSVLIGRQVKEIVRLQNNEAIPFAFSFNDTSFEVGPKGIPVLRFTPTSGTIAGHSEMPIEISFIPSAEKSFNFNLVCNVRRRLSPITINVKGEGYEIHESVEIELPDGNSSTLIAGVGSNNAVDFGAVQLNDKRTRRVTITNSGTFNFDYNWHLSAKKGSLSVTPPNGVVKRGEKKVCEITFAPSHVVTLKDAIATCHILNGRAYQLTCLGVGTKPVLKASKQAIDFGPQFMFRTGMTPASAAFQIINEDTTSLTADVLSPESLIFETKTTTITLAPGELATVEVLFYPRDAVAYHDAIKVEVNSLTILEVDLRGQGTPFRVDALNVEGRALNFGAVRVGHTVSRTVKVINRSAIPAAFHFGPQSALDYLATRSIVVKPSGLCTLRPKGTLNLDLVFHPQHRIPPFSQELHIVAPGYSRPLVLITGACQGIEVRLGNDTLPFGAVVHRSRSTRRVQIRNVGDIGTTFHWDAAKFAPDFSISPSEGYISPGMEVSLEITFHPLQLNPDVRYENLVCRVEGMQPLFLTLTGMCVPPPVQSDALKFSTTVRQSDVKSVPLINRSGTFWSIRPTIENDYWSGPEIIELEPGQTKSYDITFTPLRMTGDGDGGRHEGTIFFPFPDGTGSLYRLYGTAEKPGPVANVTRDVPCKTQYHEVLPVTNWLKTGQRFRIIMEIAKPDPSVTLKGHDFFEVPSLQTKDYKLSFYAYKEGVTTAKITFKNELTQEYAYYNVTFRSTSPGVIDTLDFNTPVRQPQSKDIVVTNPLNLPATFTVTSSSAEILVSHSLVILPRSDGIVTAEFLPLHPESPQQGSC
ncbi:hypothetical protein BC832DRAFT_104056 [Gaertneriomyces semiglobifer]|nr:hypothetical protein BC832DRAFT_104056 [Gaertneriomyces semiglobifer]